jgi:signal recognition particle subunit SRP54
VDVRVHHRGHHGLPREVDVRGACRHPHGTSPADGDEPAVLHDERAVLDRRARVADDQPRAFIDNGSRRLRIAKGSGTSVPEVNQLLKRFTEAQKVVKQLQKLGPKGLLKGMGGLGKGMLPFG